MDGRGYVVQIPVPRGQLLTQHADSGLRGHLEVRRHHVLDVEASALLLR